MQIGDNVLVVEDNWADKLYHDNLKLQYGVVTGFSMGMLAVVRGKPYHNQTTTDVTLENGDKRNIYPRETGYPEQVYEKAEFLREIDKEIKVNKNQISKLKGHVKLCNKQIKERPHMSHYNEALSKNIVKWEQGIKDCEKQISKLEGLSKEIGNEPRLAKAKIWRPKKDIMERIQDLKSKDLER